MNANDELSVHWDQQFENMFFLKQTYEKWARLAWKTTPTWRIHNLWNKDLFFSDRFAGKKSTIAEDNPESQRCMWYAHLDLTKILGPVSSWSVLNEKIQQQKWRNQHIQTVESTDSEHEGLYSFQPSKGMTAVWRLIFVRCIPWILGFHAVLGLWWRFQRNHSGMGTNKWRPVCSAVIPCDLLILGTLW